MNGVRAPGRHPSAAVLADRAAGVVLASAAGDALGAGYEFTAGPGSGEPVDMVGGGPFDWAPGEFTDDTQMALAVLDPLADGRTGDDALAHVESRFRAWFAAGPADVGNQTRTVLSTLGPLDGVATRYAAAHARAAGNGSLMRTGPVALAHPGDPSSITDLAARVSALTHADPDCVDACALWSAAIDDTLHRSPGPTEPWDWAGALLRALPMLPAGRRAPWRARIDEAVAGRPADFPNNGWVVHAFQAALAALMSTPVPVGDAAPHHLRLTLEAVVRAGGDTDTVAAIAGSLAGARWGATAVPLRWRRALHGDRTAAHSPVCAAELERLARLAFRQGHSDADGWPASPSMLPHYRAAWDLPAQRVTLAGVEFGNVHALEASLTDGVDVVVSLCRMGADEPALRDVEAHVISVLDTDAGDNPHLAFVLADLADTLGVLVTEGRRPFVHCVQAENRTPALAATLLIRHGGMDADTALALVRRELRAPRPFLADGVRQAAQL